MDRAFAHGYHGLMRDVLQRMIRDAGLKVKGYEYHDLCYRMDSIQSYFQFNLDMLNTELRHNFFREDRPIYTKVRDEMPARYMDEAVAVNSMVADGCIINGQGGAQRHLPRRKDRQGSHSQELRHHAGRAH